MKDRLLNISKSINKLIHMELITVILFKLILDYIFLVYMKHSNNYYYISDFNIYKWVFSILSIFIIYLVISQIKEDIIRFFTKLIFLVMIIPLSTVYMRNDFLTKWYCIFIIEIIILVITVRIISYITNKKNGIEKINTSRSSKMIYYIFLINTLIVLVSCIYYNGLPGMDALNLKNVYKIREAFYLPKILNYLYNFEVKFILPFLMTMYMHKKKYFNLLLVVGIQIFFYLTKADKITFLVIPMIIGIYILLRLYDPKIIEKKLSMIFSVLCVVSILTYNYNSMILAIFVTRLLVIPANLKYIYMDFFSKNPKIGIVGTLLNAIMKLKNPYSSISYPNLIAGIYFGNYSMYSNTGALVEGYVRFGYIGILIVPILLGCILHLLQYGARKNGIIFIIGISIFPIMLLNDGYLISSLMFGELLLLSIVCLFFDINEIGDKTIKKKNTLNVGNNNVIMLLDNGFDPDIRVYKEAKYLVDKKINVEIVCLDKKNKYINKKTENKDGIKIRRIFVRTNKTSKLIENYKFINKIKILIYFWWIIKFIYKIKRYLKDKEFSIIHCHDLTMTIIACIFFRKKTIVFDMHEYYGDNNNKVKDFIIKRLVKYAQNKAKWIIFVNDFQKNNCSKNNKNKLVKLPNYPQCDIFKNIIKNKSSKTRISYIGKVRDFKSLSKLINYNDTNNSIDIKIYGDGSEYDKLLELAKQKKKEYIMKGKFDGLNDSEEIYKNTDILYAVYDIEASDGKNWKNAMPIKSFEAIITLTPIIASRNTVLGDFIEKNDIGFTIDINKEELDNLVKEICENPEILNKKMKNMKKIQYLYTWDNIITNLDQIYLDKQVLNLEKELNNEKI